MVLRFLISIYNFNLGVNVLLYGSASIIISKLKASGATLANKRAKSSPTK